MTNNLYLENKFHFENLMTNNPSKLCHLNEINVTKKPLTMYKVRNGKIISLQRDTKYDYNIS